MNNQETDKPTSIKKSSANTTGISGLTSFAILLIIGGIAMTGFLYKKADGDFDAMVSLSRSFYDDTTNLLTEKYNSLINNEIDKPSNVKHNISASHDSAQTKAQLSKADEDLTIISDVTLKADKETPDTISAVTGKQAVSVVTLTSESKPAEISVIEAEPDNVISNEIASEVISSDTNLAQFANNDNSLIAEVMTQTQVETVTPVAESMGSLSANPQLPAYAPGRFNHNLYSQPTNRFYQQQQRIFEQNRRYQQQMMNQAFMLQTALLKEAEIRHQQMLKQAADWRIQFQLRRQQTHNRFNQPMYMN